MHYLDFIPATLETVTYDGKYWGAPDTSDAGILYYHTDQVKEIQDKIASGELADIPDTVK